ncbi:MAG TPA: antibiotic biosynthesis monooxygenase [Burkholderiaceae bacterium]|nr:antibiotic biosynthesis monooxygenase [Burkholderiaceae bacterium]
MSTIIGCIQFDVCIDPADRRRVFLYEVYIDRAAFEDHLNAEHFKTFDRTVASWVESKAVKPWQLRSAMSRD